MTTGTKLGTARTAITLSFASAFAAFPALADDGDRMHAIAHLFEEADVVSGPEEVDCRLSDGAETTCFRITVRSLPKDRQTGPWCPTAVTDGPENAGIWLEGGAVHDADGSFMASLAEVYDDPNWSIIDPETGAVNFTETAEECAAAARPDVDPALQNHCVQCLPDYVEQGLATTYTIPLDPVASDAAPDMRRGGSGLALDGVKLDGPAPVGAILGAHTVASFDDCGGHINLAEGYHYHAVTGCQEEAGVALEAVAAGLFPAMDAPLIGIALDGYPVLAHEVSVVATLDDCGGHPVDGAYHYHAGASGSNRILGCFTAQQGCASHEDGAVCDATQRPRRP